MASNRGVNSIDNALGMMIISIGSFTRRNIQPLVVVLIRAYDRLQANSEGPISLRAPNPYHHDKDPDTSSHATTSIPIRPRASYAVSRLIHSHSVISDN